MSTRARRWPLTEALPQYVEALTSDLEKARADARRCSESPTLAAFYEGQASMCRLALSYLHTWTEGRYGAALDSQPADTTEENR